MLSEREQRVLDDIELRLVLEDPHFVATMAGRTVLSWRRVVAVYVTTVAVFLGIVSSFLAGLYVLSACLASAAAAVMLGYALGAWHRRRARRRSDGLWAA